MTDRRTKLGRRSVLKGLAAGTAAAALPTILMRKASAQQEKTLRIVQWKHFVPDYDRWFTQFAQQFGEKNKCTVQVDYVATPDLPTAIAADISRGGGHDVFHLNGTGAWLYEQVLVDVSDVATKLEKEHGPWIKESTSIGQVKGKWLAIPSWYISYPLIINSGYFKEAGETYTEKTTWQELIKSGAKLKKAAHPFGIPVSNTPDANDDLLPWMWSFDATTFDKDGKVAFKRKEIVEWLRHAKEFYEQTMTEEVLGWDDSSNNRFIASGKGSMVCNPISAYRTAAKDNPDVFKNLAVVKTPLGPKGRFNGARTMSYGIYNFSKVQDLAKEFLAAMDGPEFLKGFEASTGYNHPFLRAFLKKPMPVIGNEPKLQLLQDFQEDVHFIGYPGPMTKTATSMYAKFIMPTMLAEVCKGKNPRQAMEEAEQKLRGV
ncbi:MAG: ABC transporter substrate-binding protein [Myxococcales bacterium]